MKEELLEKFSPHRKRVSAKACTQRKTRRRIQKRDVSLATLRFSSALAREERERLELFSDVRNGLGSSEVKVKWRCKRVSWRWWERWK